MDPGTALILVFFALGSPAVTSTPVEGVRQQASQSAVPEEGAPPQGARGEESPQAGMVGWLERAGRLFDDEDESTRGFFPLFNVIVARSGPAFGGGYRDHAVFGSRLGFETAVLFSVNNYRLYRARLGFLKARRQAFELRSADTHVSSMAGDDTRNQRGLSVYLDARYRYYPREHFYGVGAGSRENDGTNYRVQGGSYDLVMAAQATRTVGFSARVGILESSLGEGSDPDEPLTPEHFAFREAPGITEQPRYLAAGFGVALDTREDARDPRNGVFLGGAVWRLDAQGGGRFDFTRLAFDGRTYFAPSRHGVVALRVVVCTDLVAAGGEVPFFLSQTLGGSQLLRSYPGARFRDRALAHGTVEYRMRPHRLLELAPFLDVGTVGRSLTAFRARDVTVSVGIALRATWKGRVLGRVEYAVGREGQRVVFAKSQVF